jgi:hypothetical protein
LSIFVFSENLRRSRFFFFVVVAIVFLVQELALRGTTSKRKIEFKRNIEFLLIS